jgi:hypothetical protein
VPQEIALYYQIKHPPGIVANVTVNDVPFYRRVVDHNAAPAGPFNHMLVPGKNLIEVSLAEVPGATPAHVERGFAFQVRREDDDVVLFDATWPAFAAEYPEEQRKLPIVHARHFEPPFEARAPIWGDAATDYFPPEGTPELHAPVKELHAAYARADVDAFMGSTALKMDLHRRYYGAMPETDAAAARAHIAGQLAEPWDVRPLELAELVFERRCGGRVAYVTRRDGGHALLATHKADPGQAWTANLYLTRPAKPGGGHEGWRIFW